MKFLKWLLVITVILIVCFVSYFIFAIYILSGETEHVDVNESFREHYDKRNELIQLVETYQLEYDENGLLTNLDKVGLSGLASEDRVYVRYQEEDFIVEFLINPGFPDEGQSIYYSSGGKKLLEEKIDKILYAKIELLDGNWYFVQWN